MDYSERTHSLVNIAKHLPGIKIPSEIVDNVRLLKNNEGNDYQLIVMDKLDNDPLYFDFKTQLIKKSIRPIVSGSVGKSLPKYLAHLIFRYLHHQIRKVMLKIKSLALSNMLLISERQIFISELILLISRWHSELTVSKGISKNLKTLPRTVGN
ncbi:TPA: hypothetical protein ACJFZJ_003001 [Salmonella enterica subsp. enterica serovar Sundsvall]